MPDRDRPRPTGCARALSGGDVALQLRLPPDNRPPAKIRCKVLGPNGWEWQATRAYLSSGRRPFLSQFVFPRDFGGEMPSRTPEAGTYRVTWSWRKEGIPQECAVSFEYGP